MSKYGWNYVQQLCALVLMGAMPTIMHADELATSSKHEPKVLHTTSGVRYGILDDSAQKPAPTLIFLSSTLEQSLGEPEYLLFGDDLLKKGFICVSLDLPCHGQERQANEPEGLAGWRYRIDRGEDLFTKLAAQTRDVLDDLIHSGKSDENKIVVCGISRGSLAAMHVAAHEPRIRCITALIPVTDLSKLSEFHDMQQPDLAKALSASSLVSQLIDRDICVIIGDQDQRVGTDNAIAFARSLSAAAATVKRSPNVELHVLPEPRGHWTPPGTTELATEWVLRKVANHPK